MALPEHTQSFALIVYDKDSPLGFKFTHWVLYDIPPEKRELAEDVAKQEQLRDGSRQGLMTMTGSATSDPVRRDIRPTIMCLTSMLWIPNSTCRPELGRNKL